jgi:cysteine desulfurase
MATGHPIYLDYNATTPVGEEAAAAMTPLLAPGLAGGFANPSSSHAYAALPREALATARRQVGALLGAAPGDVVFCSGGTESINTVLKGLALERWRATSRPAHVVTSAVEHVAVTEALAWLQRHGFATTTVVGVGDAGVVDPDAVAAAVGPDTVCVSVMLANNETGAVQPLAAIAAAVRARAAQLGLPPHAVAVHTDASQAAGKLPVDVPALGVDFVTLAGHKLYAPKGVGATVTRPGGPRLPVFMHGAGQEGGARAGTENVPYAAALGAACAAAAARLAGGHAAKQAALRDRLGAALLRRCPDEAGVAPVVHGPLAAHLAGGSSDGSSDGLPPSVPLDTLPNTLYVSFPGAFAAHLLARLRGAVACSAGAACHTPALANPDAPGAPVDIATLAAGAHPSHVLTAMGVPAQLAVCTLRLSTGLWTTQEDVDAAADHIVRAVAATVARTRGANETAPAATPAPSSASAAAPPLQLLPLVTEQLYLHDTYRFTCPARVVGVAAAAATAAAADGPAGSPTASSPTAASPTPAAQFALLADCGSHPAGTVVGGAVPWPAPDVHGPLHALVLDATIAHPQGGGQPSDRGVVVFPDTGAGASSHVGFEFWMVKPAAVSAPGGGAAILHYGRFVTLAPAAVADPAAAADALPEAAGGAATGSAPLAPADVAALLPALVGAPASVAISSRHRRLAARLHSAGHVLDQAVKQVYAALAAAGTPLEPLKPGKGCVARVCDGGQSVLGGKGTDGRRFAAAIALMSSRCLLPAPLPHACRYHFADGPFVEYIGAVPPGWRDKLPPLLDAACAELVAAATPTSVAYVGKGDAGALVAAGLTPSDCDHLSDDRPVRIVAVGGAGNPCPCGGTHVRTTAELGRVTVRGLKVAKGKTTVKYAVE